MCATSSTATVSNQPMSLLGIFQLVLSLNAIQQPSMTTPRPQEVLASMKMERGKIGPGGRMGRLNETSARRKDHHLRSVRRARDGQHREKISPWKDAAKLESEGRWDHPFE
jgi:hypothetical protein